MSRIDYQRLINEAKRDKELTQNFTKLNHLRLTPGTHSIKLIDKGNDLDITFYRYSRIHSWGSGAEFRKMVCWDYLVNDHKDRVESLKLPKAEQRPVAASLQTYLEEADKIKKADVLKAIRFGCPMCVAREFLTSINASDELKAKVKTSNEYWFNVYYVKRIVPKEDDSSGDKLITPGHYLYTLGSVRSKNDLVSAIEECVIDLSDAGNENPDPLDLKNGMNLRIKREGTGQNNTRYFFSFKGNLGDKWFRIVEDGQNKIGDVDNPPFYNLVTEVEANYFHTYQQAIAMAKKHWGNVLSSNGFKFDGEDMETEHAEGTVSKEAAKKFVENAGKKSEPDDFDLLDDDELGIDTGSKPKGKSLPKSKTKIEIDEDDIPF